MIDVCMIIATLIAAFAAYYGPIKAVNLTRDLDDKRSKRDRKMLILRSLMMHRNNRLHSDFVGALNLIEVEFYDKIEIINSWKSLNAEYKKKDFNIGSLNSAVAELIKSIAQELGYKIDKLELLNNAYIPQGWQNDQDRFDKRENLLIELLEGSKELNINVSRKQKDK